MATYATLAYAATLEAVPAQLALRDFFIFLVITIASLVAWNAAGIPNHVL